MRKVIFAEGQVYHIYNRGTDKREIFPDDYDRYRFVQDLQYMNSPEPVLNSGYSFIRNCPVYIDSDHFAPPCKHDTGNTKLVDILAFALMPNHYHLLLMQRLAGGIASFMQKLGTAYAMYFNKRYQRTGVLFEGPFKAVMIKEENHFEGIPFYIHANPLKLGPLLPSVELKMEFLRKYKWSSFQDYAGIPNFPSIISKPFLEELFARDGGFYTSMSKWLENRKKPPIEARPR